MTLATADKLMRSALEEEVFTAGVLLVSWKGTEHFLGAYGTVAGPASDAVAANTLFDLASLTKVAATTPCWLLLAADAPAILDQGLNRWFPDAPPDKAPITPRQLLAHGAGLPAWRPYYLLRTEKPRKEFVRDLILAEPLQYPPGRGCLYSDLGFMLLGFILEYEYGMNLDCLVRKHVYQPLGLAEEMVFIPDAARMSIALTRHGDPFGLVNDLNARSLGGVAGHAGLFGTAGSLAGLAHEILRSLKSDAGFFDRNQTRAFCSRAGFSEGATRALGFDTPSVEGSSNGSLFSPDSVGHTGFTGTSLWMDTQRDLTVVILTNRVLMGESDFRIKDLRPGVHDAVIADITA